jgi:hypothetical protein
MPERTPCNRCTYSRITKEAEAAGQDVELRNQDGLIVVYVGGKWAASFMELPARCACSCGARMRAQERVLALTAERPMPCPACGSKKNVSYWYEDMVLAIFHWPSLAECTGCGWAYQKEEV